MRTGGSYVKDPKTGETTQVAKPTESHPDGDGARDADGTLIGGWRVVGEKGPELETPGPARIIKAKPSATPAADSGTNQE